MPQTSARHSEILDGYRRGLTPNPDVMCNSRVKFGVFAAYARTEGFQGLATGHYAQRVESSQPPASRPSTLGLRQFQLFEGADSNKDQSYFLALLNQEQLAFARFPIGHLKKPALRALARQARLPTADKKDSQGICFIGEVKMADFLKAYVPEDPGPIVRAGDERVPIDLGHDQRHARIHPPGR